MKKISSIKKENLLQLLISLVIIIAFNVISAYYFYRFDLTQEKRYSLSSSTKNIINDLKDIVYVKVYLDGDLPVNYKQLHNATRELLDEFRAYNTDIQFQFIDPSADENKEKRFKLYRQLATQGLAYYQVPVENKDGFAQKTVFTGAMISYKDRMQPINLVQSSKKVPDDVEINNSIQKLELNIISAIRKVTQKKPATIAFAQGHGELDEFEMGDLSYDLSQTYNVGLLDVTDKLENLCYRVSIDSTQTKVVNKFDMLVIAKPDSIFDDKAKFLIDQFIMHGGKVVWLIDAVDANMDSLRASTTTIGLRKELGLSEMLYRYGVRLNPELILNRNALEIGTAEGQLRTWDFFPIALPVPGSIITANLNSVRTQFVSSLDLVGSDAIKKTVLLTTDNHTRVMPTPAIIDVVDIIYRKPNRALYNNPPKNVAVLLEGEFESYFTSKIIDPRIAENKNFDILSKSVKTSQLVISCGDIIRNDIIQSANGPTPLPLGYDRFSKKFYDNKKFIMNAINYMMNDKELINLRNKDFKIRLLNKEVVAQSRLKWQLINTILPVLLILILGIVLVLYKKRKFAR